MGHDGSVGRIGSVFRIAALGILESSPSGIRTAGISSIAIGALAVAGAAGCDTAEGRKPLATERGAGAPKRPPTPVAVSTANRGPIASFYVTTTTLEPEKTAPVLARVNGVIERLAVEEGDTVKSGKALLYIESDQYKLRVAQLAARTAQLRDSHKRLRKMVARKLVGTEEFEKVKHDLEGAQAEEKLARLELSYTTVRAPFTGRVVRRMVEVGHTVAPSVPLFELADLEPLLARVYVPSKAFKRLARSQPVELELDSTQTKLTGHIKLVSPVIDPASGTIKVTLEIPEYPPGTRPGDFAHVRITTEQHDDALLVPRIAVVQDRQERVVFVVVDGRAQRRIVEVGFEQGGQAEILKGLAAGEKVVVKGQTALKDGAAVKILES